MKIPFLNNISVTGGLSANNTTIIGSLTAHSLSARNTIVGETARIFSTASPTVIVGNGTTGSIRLGDGTFSKTTGSPYSFDSGVRLAGATYDQGFSFTAAGSNVGIWSAGTGIISFSNNITESMRLNASGNLGINSTTDINERLTVKGNVSSTGTGFFSHVAANTKSFFINHPTKQGKKLQYGSLESPYHGIRITGRDYISKDKVIIKLPDYVNALVKEEGINIQITNICHSKIMFIKDINLKENYFIVGIDKSLLDFKKYEFYWSFTAIRKDIPDLQVEV